MHSKGYGTWLCLSVCLSVKSYLTSGVSVHPENTVTYSAGNRGPKYLWGFLWNSSIAEIQHPLRWKTIHTVSHFLRKSRMRMAPRFLHFSSKDSVLISAMTWLYRWWDLSDTCCKQLKLIQNLGPKPIKRSLSLLTTSFNYYHGKGRDLIERVHRAKSLGSTEKLDS